MTRTYLTTGMVAKILGYSVNTVRKLMDQGLLKHHKIREIHRRVHKDDMKEFIETQVDGDVTQMLEILAKIVDSEHIGGSLSPPVV